MPKVPSLPDGNSIDVPAGTTILAAAQQCHAQVGFACGGTCACPPCHVYVRKGFDSLSEMEEREDDILDRAFDVQPQSRLGCQSKIADEDVVCEITRESRQAWLDEHPEEREKLRNQKAG